MFFLLLCYAVTVSNIWSYSFLCYTVTVPNIKACSFFCYAVTVSHHASLVPNKANPFQDDSLLTELSFRLMSILAITLRDILNVVRILQFE